ncbi:MAG: HD domain-containing protein, partial [Clostridiaceae bacterium]
HDIGHVPFAHNGEEVLDKLNPDGFKHNENSVRVLTKIEKQGRGLNLTHEVLDGILHHSGFSHTSPKAYTLEGQVVRYSDKIAYVNHDIDDSIRAGLLSEDEIPEEFLRKLGDTHGRRIDTLVRDCIYTTLGNIENGNIVVSLSREGEQSLAGLRKFMFHNIYKGEILKQEREKAKFILEQVYKYFLENPKKMPNFYYEIVQKEGLYTGVTDYISGMSDDYCLLLFNELYVPKLVIY